MEITIVGCGNAGSAVAADLVKKGHNVTLLKSSMSDIHNAHFEKIKKDKKILLVENGDEFSSDIVITQNYEEAIKGKQIIIIFVQTNYHESVIKEICKYLEDDQIVLIEPGYLSTCYFLKYCSKKITIAEAESSPIDCRIILPGVVNVLFRNVCNPIGIFPSQNVEKARLVLDQLDYNFIYSETVVSAALHNPNLIVHTVGAIMSIPRIEYASKHNIEYSMYKEAFTPLVWNLVLQLDKEKMDILEKLNCKRIPYVEACKLRNSTDKDKDATSVFFEYANNSAPSGPSTPDSRYLTEDVPQGLVMLESLGKVFSVSTPICSSLIDIASSMLKRDFRNEGRTVEKLGLDNILSVCK